MSEQFDHRTAQDDKVFVFWRGRVVTTLKGERGHQFLASAGSHDPDGRPLLMAKITGNFKRGNER